MLTRLHIENFALIDLLDIDFDDGLNVLTGSTGAGKSIIIGALDLILGGRGTEEIIRTGESACIVEGTFRLDDKKLGPALSQMLDIRIEHNSITIRREYRRKGGGRAFIDNSQIAITGLKDVAENLADILGQHSHQALLNPDTHCTYLDRYAKLEDKVSELRELYSKTIDLRDRLLASDRIAREIADRIDLLTFQTSEIEKSKLRPDEENVLKEERKLLENAQKIRETAEAAASMLLEDDSSALEKLGETEKSLAGISNLSETIDTIINALKGAGDSIRDAVIELKSFSERIDADPQRLEEVNERLNEIFRLKKKYGAGISEILDYASKAGAELARLKSQETDTKNLKKLFDESWQQLNSMAAQVSIIRRKAAPGFEKLVVEKLMQMGIPKAQFVVNITFHESETGLYEERGKKVSGDSMGFDDVEFQFCANPGEGLKPLARIASGGEISRVMLALKNAFLHKKGGTCEIFDEIDVGISGDVAAKVAKQLRELSRKHQVICITHLHQIASMADNHFRVFKTSLKGRSVTRVLKLNKEERVEEIAILLSGEKVTDKAIAGARELLKNSSEEK